MSPVKPDMQGFANAQDRLRGLFGVTATFLVPVERSFDDDVGLDPQTGVPFDAYADAEPVAGAPEDGFERVEVLVSKIARPLNRLLADERYDSPLGMIDADSMGLILSVEDAERIEGATHVLVEDERFRVTDVRHDSLGEVGRAVAFLKRG